MLVGGPCKGVAAKRAPQRKPSHEILTMVATVPPPPVLGPDT